MKMFSRSFGSPKAFEFSCGKNVALEYLLILLFSCRLVKNLIDAASFENTTDRIQISTKDYAN